MCPPPGCGQLWIRMRSIVDGDSEDDIYDLLDEVDPDEVLYLELQEGAADVLIRMDAFIPNPVAVRGREEEIETVEKWLCRKVR